MTEDELRREFERQHAGRNLTRHRLRGTYVAAPIAALWNQHKRTYAWLKGLLMPKLLDDSQLMLLREVAAAYRAEASTFDAGGAKERRRQADLIDAIIEIVAEQSKAYVSERHAMRDGGTQMIGRNMLCLNPATMIEAVQVYLDDQFGHKKAPKVTAVDYDNDAGEYVITVESPERKTNERETKS